MTKGDIMNRVQELTQDNSGAMRNLISRWVDLTLQDIASRVQLPSLFREESTSFAQGQYDYSLKDDTDHVLKVFVPAWGELQGLLTKLDYKEMLDQMLEDGFSKQARPQYYTTYGITTLRVWPAPDSDNSPASPTSDQKLHIFKYRDITTLAETDNITELKLKHLWTVIWGTYAYGARFDTLGDVPDALSRYINGITQLKLDVYKDFDRPRATAYHNL